MKDSKNDDMAPNLYLNNNTPTGAIALRVLAGSACFMEFMSIFLKDYTVASWQFDMFDESKPTYQFSLLLITLVTGWLSYLVVDSKKAAQGIKNKSDEMRAEVIGDAFHRAAKNKVAPDGLSWNPLTLYSQRQAIKQAVHAAEKSITAQDAQEINNAADDLIEARRDNRVVAENEAGGRLYQKAQSKLPPL